MLVGRYMTRDPLTATPHTTHREALNVMRQHKIRRLPVVEGKRVVGIISEKDLLSTSPSPATTLSIYEIYTLLDKLKVGQFMTKPVVAVAPGCPLQDAAQIMMDRKIGCLPVIENNELIGIITETDILRVLVGLLGGGQHGIHFSVHVQDKPGVLASLSEAVAEAGGNIISVNVFRSSDGSLTEVAIKEQGADIAKLGTALEALDAGMVNILGEKPYEPILID